MNILSKLSFYLLLTSCVYGIPKEHFDVYKRIANINNCNASKEMIEKKLSFPIEKLDKESGYYGDSTHISRSHGILFTFDKNGLRASRLFWDVNYGTTISSKPFECPQ